MEEESSIRKVGLLLVHGIGDQNKGDLAGRVASQLRDLNSDAASAPKVKVAIIIDEDAVLSRRVSLGNVDILIREANWSSISNPDNPVDVRSVAYLLSNFFNSLKTGVNRSLVKLRNVQLKELSLPRVIGTVAVIAALPWVFLFYLNELEGGDEWDIQSKLVVTIVAGMQTGFLGACVLAFPYVVRSFVEQQRARLVHATVALQRIGLTLAWLVALTAAFPVALLLVIGHFYGAVLLLFALIALVLAVLLNWIAIALATILNTVARGFERIHLTWVCLWVRRICWTTVVMPAYGILSVIKAEFNLISVLLSNASGRYKTVATIGLPIVYLGYIIVYMVVLEIPILAAIAPWIFPRFIGTAPLPVSDAIALTIVLFGVSLIVVKLFLPAIDLLLDIAHYHLASRSRRSKYHLELKHGIQFLEKSGCEEIHILAHSLGTVLTIDLLQSGIRTQSPIRVLHTIGSPLDKFWYFDRTHRRGDGDTEIIEHSELRWLNYWTWSDPISGSVNHFSLPERKVRNQRLNKLNIPVVSHVMYWDNKTLLKSVQDQILETKKTSVVRCG